MSSDVLRLQSASLAAAGVAHGFFGRTGGVSTGLYASLNGAPASRDDPAAIRENRDRVSAAFGAAPLVTLQQYHSAVTVTVTKPWSIEDSPRGDALVTNQPGLLIGLNTADCAPVLLADPVAKIVGAAHAGWKGAVAGVCESVIAAMEALGASRANIRAAIGPCISQPSYEVGPDFRAGFPAAASVFFKPALRAGYFFFDLESYVADRLAQAGIGAIDTLGACTLANPDKFFSFRRATLAAEPDYGRELSVIMLVS
ncbi:MAG: peptidoglycan editing factor PgeF [Rhizomicrobium sp.]